MPRNLPKVKLAQVTHNLLRQYLGNSYEYDIQGNTVLKRLSPAVSQAPSLLPAQNQAAQIAFVYDADNRLVQATRSWTQAGSPTEQTARYSYDAFGRRIAKQVTEQGKTDTTLFVWDGDVLIQEIYPDSTITYLYEPGSFVPLARVQSQEGMASYGPSADENSATDAIHLPQQAQWGLPQDRHAADAHLAKYAEHQADLTALVTVTEFQEQRTMQYPKLHPNHPKQLFQTLNQPQAPKIRAQAAMKVIVSSSA